MTTSTLEIVYDAEADLLEVFIGTPTPTVFDEIDDDLFEGRDKSTNELKGYKVFSFLKRGGMDGVRIPLPAGVRIESVSPEK